MTTEQPQPPPITLSEYAASLFHGERWNLAFKFLRGASDERVAGFLDGLLAQVRDTVDSGDVGALARYVQQAQAASYTRSPRASAAQVGAPAEDAPIPWVTLKRPLREARVALLTTGAVHHKDDAPFHDPNHSYEEAVRNARLAYERMPALRSIPSDTPSSELRASHVAYDVTAANQDVNVMLPLDRLRELADEGVIGGVAPEHYSFHGLTNFQRLREQAAPEWGRMIADRGDIDAVVLTPG
jgi:D-proline reductase (dithiol) PrdB